MAKKWVAIKPRPPLKNPNLDISSELLADTQSRRQENSDQQSLQNGGSSVSTAQSYQVMPAANSDNSYRQHTVTKNRCIRQSQKTMEKVKMDGRSSTFRSRKSHKKSHTGCRTCKRRHLKCDETMPQWYVLPRMIPPVRDSGQLIDVIAKTAQHTGSDANTCKHSETRPSDLGRIW